uniref:BTB domain-containing protein n=1 Tax=Panagrolaimus sp. ES5 TaxID=591445 RepID=A0AC34G5F5_9BILA
MDFRPFLVEDVLTITQEELKEIVVQKKKQYFEGVTKTIEIPSVNYYWMGLIYNNTEEHEPNSDMFTAFLTLEFSDGTKLRGKISFYVQSGEYVVESGDNIMVPNEQDYHCVKKEAFSLTDVLKPVNKFIENGVLTLKVKGMLFRDLSDAQKQRAQTTLGHFLWKCDDRDFVISVGKNAEFKSEIKLHKNVLASRSPVFNAMVKSEMKEKAEGRVEIIDFDVEVVQSAVEFFYDRDTYRSLDLDKLVSLLHFAEKYDIKDMKAELERTLCFHLSPGNICQITNASLASNSSMLKQFTIQTMILFIRQKVPFADSDALEKDFMAEMIHIASTVV